MVLIGSNPVSSWIRVIMSDKNVANTALCLPDTVLLLKLFKKNSRYKFSYICLPFFNCIHPVLPPTESFSIVLKLCLCHSEWIRHCLLLVYSITSPSLDSSNPLFSHIKLFRCWRYGLYFFLLLCFYNFIYFDMNYCNNEAALEALK